MRRKSSPLSPNWQISKRPVTKSSPASPIGFAVFFFSYSTWLGSNCLYLEDLYITPEQRGGGAGKTLLRHLAKIACANDCGRFEWSVLEWNTPAIEFYKSLGAQPQEEWVRYRMDGKVLREFAEG
jgi:GNAT superfamily N-acetyltransferase